MATQDDTIAFLCKLVSLVGTKVYHSQIEHDCFCSETRYLEPARFESVHSEILAYISNAVTDRIKAEAKDPASDGSEVEIIARVHPEPLLSPCKKPMSLFPDFSAHITSCRVCGDALNE